MNDEVAPTSLQTAPPSIPDTPPARRDSRFSAQRPQSSHTGGAVHSGARPAPFAGLRPPLAARLAAQLAEQRAARRAAPLAPSKRAVHQKALGPLGPSFAPWDCSDETALQIAVQWSSLCSLLCSLLWNPFDNTAENSSA